MTIGDWIEKQKGQAPVRKKQVIEAIFTYAVGVASVMSCWLFGTGGKILSIIIVLLMITMLFVPDNW